MKHEWRAMIQYKLSDEEARQMVQGYGHPEIDNAPIQMLASDQKTSGGRSSSISRNTQYASRRSGCSLLQLRNGLGP